MIERINPILGTDISTFPFFVKLHMDISLASSIFLSVLFALSTPFEKVSRISWRLFASGCAKFGASKESCAAAAATFAGADAMCRANWPREKAFGWGFHASL